MGTPDGGEDSHSPREQRGHAHRMPDVKCPTRWPRPSAHGAGLPSSTLCGDDGGPPRRCPPPSPPPTGGYQALEMWPARPKNGIFSFTHFNVFKVKLRSTHMASGYEISSFRRWCQALWGRRTPRLTARCSLSGPCWCSEDSGLLRSVSLCSKGDFA